MAADPIAAAVVAVLFVLIVFLVWRSNRMGTRKVRREFEKAHCAAQKYSRDSCDCDEDKARRYAAKHVSYSWRMILLGISKRVFKRDFYDWIVSAYYEGCSISYSSPFHLSLGGAWGAAERYAEKIFANY